MNAWKWIGIGIIITLSAVMLAFAIGWFLWRNGFSSASLIPNRDSLVSLTNNNLPCKDPSILDNPNTIGTVGNLQCTFTFSEPSRDNSAALISDNCISESGNEQIVCPGNSLQPQDFTDEASLSWRSVYVSLQQYLADIGLTGLEISEVMEFEDNYYVLITEIDTGMGAMELLVDKWDGAVSSEMGPNMMWNTKYSMHSRGMMTQRNIHINTLSEKAVLSIAQEWLSSHLPGSYVGEHADQLYGYYTLLTLMDGQIQGMLSVHARTGQVWYHNWHGAFVQMLNDEIVQ